MSNGGKRPGAGRPAVQIDERRVMTLVDLGVSQRDIAERFGVALHIIKDRVRKLKKLIVIK